MPNINFALDKVSGYYVPTRYPVKSYADMAVPETISRDFNKLTSVIEDKYLKEFLKVCAFYNKLFPSIKQYDWSRSSYNVLPFTIQDQERADTGTGISSNYLKGIIDLVTARVGNTTFDYKLIADMPTALYTIYKDEIERVLKSFVRRHKLNRISVESFHDAAILGFAHVFIDPWSGDIRKVSDWELGCYEAEFNDGRLKRVMIRDYAFPVSALGPYIEGWEDVDLKAEIDVRQQVDLRLYIDCFRHEKYVSIGSRVGPATKYPFNEVLLASFSWDLGVRKTTISSLFDVLYPLQRALNKLLAKKTQLLTMYKGPVPIFNQDCDIIVKQLSNAAGEALFMDTQRNPADVVTILQPTPLDPELNAEVEALKAQMFELAGVQQISMDIENYRSAAAVIALDQMRDAGFQSQLAALAQFIRDIILMYVRYNAHPEITPVDSFANIAWADLCTLVDQAYIDIIPVHSNDATAKADAAPKDPDYAQMYIDKFIVRVLKGEATYFDTDFSFDPQKLRQTAAMRLVELRAIDAGDYEETNRLVEFLVLLYIEDMKLGVIQLAPPPVIPGEEPVPEEVSPVEGEMAPEGETGVEEGVTPGM